MLLFVVFLSGCAIGNRYAYHSVVVEPNSSGRSRVSVATHDQRAYVVSGNKDPQFVGLQHGGFGNPFDVRTDDGRPLADNVTTAIVAAMRRRGFQAVPVFVPASADAAQLQQRLLQDIVDFALLLTLREWKSDTLKNVALEYNVTLVVMNRAGQVVAKKDLQGRDNLGGSYWNPPAHAKDAVPQAFKSKLEELLGDPLITGVLQ